MTNARLLTPHSYLPVTPADSLPRLILLSVSLSLSQLESQWVAHVLVIIDVSINHIAFMSEVKALKGVSLVLHCASRVTYATYCVVF